MGCTPTGWRIALVGSGSPRAWLSDSALVALLGGAHSLKYSAVLDGGAQGAGVLCKEAENGGLPHDPGHGFAGSQQLPCFQTLS